MTDEEKAVNWIRSQGWSEENLPSDEFEQMSQAFLAGLKADKDIHVPTKWHDLRKNPNDLPLRRCIDSNGDVVGLFRHSWDKKPTWYRYDFHEREWWQMETEPIAWCEIPKFEEK